MSSRQRRAIGIDPPLLVFPCKAVRYYSCLRQYTDVLNFHSFDVRRAVVDRSEPQLKRAAALAGQPLIDLKEWRRCRSSASRGGPSVRTLAKQKKWLAPTAYAVRTDLPRGGSLESILPPAGITGLAVDQWLVFANPRIKALSLFGRVSVARSNRAERESCRERLSLRPTVARRVL